MLLKDGLSPKSLNVGLFGPAAERGSLNWARRQRDAFSDFGKDLSSLAGVWESMLTEQR